MRRWRTFEPGSLGWVCGVDIIGFAPVERVRPGFLTFAESAKWAQRLPITDGPAAVIGAHAPEIRARGHIWCPDDSRPAAVFWQHHRAAFDRFGPGNDKIDDPDGDLADLTVIDPFKVFDGYVVPPLGGIHIGEDVRVVGRSEIALGIYGEDTELHDHVRIDNGVHIGHSAIIRRRATVCANATLGGWCEIGERAFIGINATILPGVIVGAHALVGAGAVVTKDVPPDTVVMGNPARPHTRKK